MPGWTPPGYSGGGGGGGELVELDVVPSADVAYSVVGGALVGAGGILDGWEINADAKLNSMADVAVDGWTEWDWDEPGQMYPDYDWTYAISGLYAFRKVIGDFDLAVEWDSISGGSNNRTAFVGACAVDDGGNYHRSYGASLNGWNATTTRPTCAARTPAPQKLYQGGAISWQYWSRFVRDGSELRWLFSSDGSSWDEPYGPRTLDCFGNSCRLCIGVGGNGGVGNIVRVKRLLGSFTVPTPP
jgi:hypothetical protein